MVLEMPRKPGTPKTRGRLQGSKNRHPALLKDAILQAAVNAGNEDRLIGYLTSQAIAKSGHFMTLRGKVIPLQVQGARGLPVVIAKDDLGL